MVLLLNRLCASLKENFCLPCEMFDLVRPSHLYSSSVLISHPFSFGLSASQVWNHRNTVQIAESLPLIPNPPLAKNGVLRYVLGKLIEFKKNCNMKLNNFLGVSLYIFFDNSQQFNSYSYFSSESILLFPNG